MYIRESFVKLAASGQDTQGLLGEVEERSLA